MITSHEMSKIIPIIYLSVSTYMETHTKVEPLCYLEHFYFPLTNNRSYHNFTMSFKFSVKK